MFSSMFCSKILMLSVVMLDVMEPNQAVLEGLVNRPFLLNNNRSIGILNLFLKNTIHFMQFKRFLLQKTLA
jgi:hypothetical protein